MEKSRVHLLIRGYVHGVFFRASTQDMAYSFDLHGWVTNVPDGSVEAVFEGPADEVEKAVQWCRKGPPGANVTGVDERWLDYTGEFNDFEIKYDF